MSTRSSLQHFVSNVEPTGAALGDEWYNSATGILYKRLVMTSGVQWVSMSGLGSMGGTSSSSNSVSGAINGITPLSYTVTTNTLPSLRPALLMDFLKARVLDARLTTTRASIASYFDGISTVVVEENMFLKSNDFATGWSFPVGASITVNSIAAPDGTTTASTYVLPATANSWALYQNSSALIINETYTASIFAKAGTRRYLQLRVQGQNEEYVNFDLQTGIITVTNGTLTGKIDNYGNSWYRCSITYRCLNTDRYPSFVVISSINSINNESWTPSLNDTMYFWGAQLEKKALATDYQLTVATRIANTVPRLMFAANNEPRFDCFPITGLSRGLLIEDQKTNLLTYSQDFSNSVWTITGGTIRANAITAPDNTITFGRLIENSSTGNHNITRTISLTSADYTLSIFVKPAGRTWVQLGWNDGSTERAVWFDLTKSLVGAVSGAAVGSIVSIGNSTYRVAVTYTSAIASVFVRSGPSEGASSYTGNGAGGLYLWGIQLEAGSYMTSYIPTLTNVTVTRPVDSVKTFISAFPNCFNPNEGTLLVESSSFGNTPSTSVSAEFNNGTSLFNIGLRHNGAGLVTQYGSVQYSASLGTTPAVDTVVRTAIGYSAAATIHARDGVLGTEVNAIKLPDALDRLTIGNRGDEPTTGSAIVGYIRRLVYYPEKLTNLEIQAITTQ
jgi:hypothetical protein